jgi:predicted membrane protein
MTNFKNKQQSPIIAGSILIIIGVIILLQKLNIHIPTHFIHWQYIPIIAGLYFGYKKNFGPSYSWVIPIAIGGLFLLSDVCDIDVWQFFIPIVFIGAGILFILNTNGRNKWLKNNFSNTETNTETNYTEDEQFQHASTNNDFDSYIDSTSIFSNIKKKVISQNFRGGSFVIIMGGVEINLMNANMQSPAVIDITSLMGGARIIVPSNWQIKNEITAIMGGVEDKRPIQTNFEPNQKILILKGTTIMGGIDIKSYI